MKKAYKKYHEKKKIKEQLDAMYKQLAKAIESNNR